MAEAGRGALVAIRRPLPEIEVAPEEEEAEDEPAPRGRSPRAATVDVAVVEEPTESTPPAPKAPQTPEPAPSQPEVVVRRQPAPSLADEDPLASAARYAPPAPIPEPEPPAATAQDDIMAILNADDVGAGVATFAD